MGLYCLVERLVDIKLAFPWLQSAQTIRPNLYPNQTQGWQPHSGGHTADLAVAPFANLDF
jgi:hypothetical protein